MATENLVPVQLLQNNPVAHTDSNRVLATSNPEVCSMEVDVSEHEGSGYSAAVNIQPDWYLTLREENGKAWITFKQRGELKFGRQKTVLAL